MLVTYEAYVAHNSFVFYLLQFTRDKSHISEIPMEEYKMLKQRQLYSCHDR